jgi:hypothetical protein
VKNCGAYAAKQLDILVGKLLSKGAEFYKAEDIKGEQK